MEHTNVCIITVFQIVDRVTGVEKDASFKHATRLSFNNYSANGAPVCFSVYGDSMTVNDGYKQGAAQRTPSTDLDSNTVIGRNNWAIDHFGLHICR